MRVRKTTTSQSTSSEEGGLKMTNHKSGKTASLRSRGNAKSTVVLSQVTGRKSGQGMRAALYEVHDEMTVYPPVSPEEAERFCRTQARRCKANLVNATARNDRRAIENLQRKLAVYEYLGSLIKTTTEQELASIKECPKCRVFALGAAGICACCGYADPSFVQAGAKPSEEGSV
jgi:hypothetical protein